jgi:SAM-dependent methyltransferase
MRQGFSNPRETWDQRFSRDDFIFGTAPNKFLESQLGRLSPGQRALCVADGEGRNGVWLARNGLQVTAFDISPVGVAKARRWAAENQVALDLQVASAETWDWQAASYDVVAAIFVQFAPPALREQMFEGMITVLRPGGWLFLQGYTPRQLEYKTGGPPNADHLYTEAMLREAFQGHELVDIREHDSVIAEGTQHAGMSALIDCVVRKAAASRPA